MSSVAPARDIDGVHHVRETRTPARRILTSMLASMPTEVAAQAESHGVIMPMTVYVEA